MCTSYQIDPPTTFPFKSKNEIQDKLLPSSTLDEEGEQLL